MYYVTHPITAGNGRNVVYETHACERAAAVHVQAALSIAEARWRWDAPLPSPCADNGQADFQDLFVTPSQTLPVVIGEFGPATDVSDMALPDAEALMQLCNTKRLPWLAWTLHMRCPPNLLVDNSNAGCGAGMPLQLTPWGTKVKTYLAMPVGPA